MKDAFKLAGAGILFLLVVSGIALYFGFFGNFLTATVGKQNMDIQRQNFKHSNSFVEGKAEDLASYKLQYEQAKTQADKDAIRQYILTTYANIDPNTIENPALANFLRQMEAGQ